MTTPNASETEAAAVPTVDPRVATMRRRRWLYGSVAGAAALAGAGLGWWESRPKNVQPPGDTLWGLTFTAPDKRTIQMREFLGRPLLINFWATWCAPCVEELPLLDRFYEQNLSKGWQVLGLAVDKATAVEQFLKRIPIQFPIALAGMEGVALSKSLGNEGGGLPYTLVLGSDGKVRHRKMGQVTTADLAQWITTK